jgi:hypothetical protein
MPYSVAVPAKKSSLALIVTATGASSTGACGTGSKVPALSSQALRENSRQDPAMERLREPFQMFGKKVMSNSVRLPSQVYTSALRIIPHGPRLRFTGSPPVL